MSLHHRSPCVEAALRELDKFGIIGKTEQRGKHMNIIWQHGTQQRSVLAAVTPSDYRAPLNTRARVRRLIRQDGITMPDPKTKPSFAKAISIPLVAPETDKERVARLEADVDTLVDMLIDLQERVSTAAQRAPAPSFIPQSSAVLKQEQAAAAAPKKQLYRDKVLFVLSYQTPTKLKEIAKKMRVSMFRVAPELTKLVREGRVERVGRGQYRKRIQEAVDVTVNGAPSIAPVAVVNAPKRKTNVERVLDQLSFRNARRFTDIVAGSGVQKAQVAAILSKACKAGNARNISRGMYIKTTPRPHQTNGYKPEIRASL